MLEEEEREELLSRVREEFSDYREFAGGKNYRYHHLVSVNRYVRKLMEKPEIRQLDFDSRVVEVAALFHDIGRKEDIEDGYLHPMEAHQGHDETGEQIVSDYIDDFLEPEQVEKVEKVIGNHHSEAETGEGKIVQDADKLVKFGSMDLWRMIHYGAEEEREITDMFEYFWNTARERHTEEMNKLHFEVSRLVARRRMNSYQDVMEEMEREYMGEDI
jgi:putative nucleotidyltransferase with HDIG domain